LARTIDEFNELLMAIPWSLHRVLHAAVEASCGMTRSDQQPWLHDLTRLAARARMPAPSVG
jgi:hypothetical protein